jgi:plastocyanin
MSLNPKVISILHIVVVTPLLWALGTGRFPEQNKNLLVYLAIGLALYHLYRLVSMMRQEKRVSVIAVAEGLENGLDCRLKNVHCIDMFDSNPGYSRPLLTVNVGDIVVWKNIGEVQHTVTSTETDGGMHPDGLFNSGNMKPGQAFAIKFIGLGEYPYYCIPHKGWMRGKIIVQ